MKDMNSLSRYIAIFSMFSYGFLFLYACHKNPAAGNANEQLPEIPLPDTIKSNNSIFTKVWTDHFDSKLFAWNSGDWTFDGNECEFTGNNVIFRNGIMKLKIAQKEAGNEGKYPNKKYWGAEYYSKDEYFYGRFVVRMKVNSPSGIVTSFFLYHAGWDDAKNRTDMNEIDIEFAGRNDQAQFTLHWIDSLNQKQSHSVIKDLHFDASEDYHLWEIEWTPDHVSFYCDGNLLHVFDDITQIMEMEYPQSIRMNYWISSYPNWVGPFDSSILPIFTEYDLVAYYRLNR